MPMSRSQWYIFSSVRLAAFGALIWAIGTWVDRSALSSFEKGICDFLGVTVSVFLINTWAVRYETYLKDVEGKESQQ
jgi:hypothetical protein